jgi:hypothetical protein
LVALPKTLSVIAFLIEIAPENKKLNDYVISCYIAYGYPDKACSYMKANEKIIGIAGVRKALSSLFFDAVNRKDIEKAGFFLREYEASLLTKEIGPTIYSSLMSYRASYIKMFLDKKDYKKVHEMVKQDFEWYDKVVKDAENHPSWSQVQDSAGYKALNFGVYFPRARFKHLNYDAIAKFNLGIKGTCYAEFEQAVTKFMATEFDSKTTLGKAAISARLQDAANAYNMLADLARMAKDTAKADEFSSKSKELREQYNALLPKK